MFLGTLKFPILPENLKEMIQIDNKKYDILGLGERVKPGKMKLHTWTVSSYFPADGVKPVKDYKKYIDDLVIRDYTGILPPEPIEPVGFKLVRILPDGGLDFDINCYVLIESIEWEDRQGEPGDLYFSIKLIEYKKFDSKTVPKG